MAELEARERFVRHSIADREREHPLRLSRSRSGGRGSARAEPPQGELRPMVFETEEEKEAALRRRRVIENTAPADERDSTGSGEKEVEWLN